METMSNQFDEGGSFHPTKDPFCDTNFNDAIKAYESNPIDSSGISTRLWMATKLLAAILSNHKIMDQHIDKIVKSMEEADISYQPKFFDDVLSSIALKQADSLIKKSKEKL